MDHRSRRTQSLALLALGLGLSLLTPAQALGRALVRFIHAVPGVGRARILVRQDGSQQTVGAIGFAQATRWHGIRSGRFEWEVIGQDKTLAQGTATVGDGAYDLVLLTQSTGVRLGIYRSRGGEPGTSLIRVIHAAPELGAPELRLDSTIVRHSLSFTKATPYLSVNPGVHSLAALKVGDSTPLVSLDNVRLTSGVAYSAVVVGSQGKRVQIVTVTDRGGPLTRRTRSGGTGRLTGATITVQRGDSLWGIARERLGAGASTAAVAAEVVAIWKLNVARIGTGDPDLIFPGTRLELPAT